MKAESIRETLGVDTANKIINDTDSSSVQMNKLMILMLANLNEGVAQLAELNEHLSTPRQFVTIDHEDGCRVARYSDGSTEFVK